jgi:hypothetical protein
MSADEAPGARVPADIAGNLVASVAVADHALTGDLCAAIRMVWRRETSAHGSRNEHAIGAHIYTRRCILIRIFLLLPAMIMPSFLPF